MRPAPVSSARDGTHHGLAGRGPAVFRTAGLVRGADKYVCPTGGSGEAGVLDGRLGELCPDAEKCVFGAAGRGGGGP